MNDPQPEGHMASYIRRRHFLATLLGGAAAWPLATRAQQRPGKVARIGFLGVGPASAWADSVEALRAGLRDLRHVEGKDIIIDLRWAERIDQLPELAAELVHMDVDIIIAPASTEVEPARQATKTIPIVFTQHADPVGIGHVASLARPGGNITGMSMVLTDLAAKAIGNFQRCCTACYSDWCPLEPYGALPHRGLEGSRSRCQELRGGAPHGAGANRFGL